MSNFRVRHTGVVMIKKKGFTLIELIIVIAILAILAAVLIPNLIGYLSTAQKTVCDDNISLIIRTYKVERALTDDVTINDIINNKDGKYFPEAPRCPSGGTYKGFSLTNDAYYVICSYHKDASSALTIAAEAYMNMDDFRGMTRDEILEELRKGLGDDTINSTRNDILREYLLKVKYGDTWPEFPKEILERNGITDTLYIQPYIDNRQSTSSNDVIVFATSNPTASGNWYTGMIFNPEDGKWYKGPAFSVNDQTWSSVKQTMQAKGWQPLQ